MPQLLASPAVIHFLSCEPLLGPVDLESAWHGETALDPECWGDCSWCGEGKPPLHNCQYGRGNYGGKSGINWVICGGESGPHARPMNPTWLESLRDQCQYAGVPFFFKQWGEYSGFTEVQKLDLPSDGWTSINGVRRRVHQFEDGSVCIRFGKKQTGRFFDGRTWDEFPKAA